MSQSLVKSVMQGFSDIEATEPLKTGLARGLGMEYHWVQLSRTDDHVANRVRFDEAMAWCKLNFKAPGVRWFEKARPEPRFYFKEEKDLTLFLLRWS